MLGSSGRSAVVNTVIQTQEMLFDHLVILCTGTHTILLNPQAKKKPKKTLFNLCTISFHMFKISFHSLLKQHIIAL